MWLLFLYVIDTHVLMTFMNVAIRINHGEVGINTCAFRGRGLMGITNRHYGVGLRRLSCSCFLLRVMDSCRYRFHKTVNVNEEGY